MTPLVPARLIFGDGPCPEVEWLHDDGLPFTEPFFEDSLRRLRRHPANASSLRPRTSARALSSAAPEVSPSGFIFHVSRCGSTLVSQMLAALPANTVIAEAPIVDDILRAPAVSDSDRRAWLRGALGLFAHLRRQRAGKSRLFVKLDCWHIFLLPLIAEMFPAAPRLFVFRDPVAVMVSLIQRPSLTLARDTITCEQLGVPARERSTLSVEEHAAAVLGALYRAAWAERARLTGVAYARLPQFVWESMPGIAFDAEEQRSLRAAARRDAKNPGARFTPDSMGKRSQASAAILAAAARWVEPHYRAWAALTRTAASFPGHAAAPANAM